MARQRKKYRGV